MADFHKAAVGDVQPVALETFVADAAHIRRAVALPHDDVVFLFHLSPDFFRQTFAGDEGDFKKEVLAQVEPLFLRLLGQMHEKAGRAHIAGNAQLLHDVKLRGGVGRPGGNGGAAQVAQRLLKHQARRGKVIVECHLYGVAGTEPHGIEGFGIAPVVVVAVFGIEDRPGGKEHAAQLADVLGQKTAQTRPHGLEEDEFLLLEDGDMLDVGNRLEFLDIELGAVKALFHILGIAVRIGQQILELDQVVLAAFAFVEHFTAAVDAFRTVFAGHGGLPCRYFGIT